MNEDFIKAVVQKVMPTGEHGPFAVATSEQLEEGEGSVTFSLEPTVWKEDGQPEEGETVFLSELRKKRAGWRAKYARFLKPSDEQKANSNKQTERSNEHMKRKTKNGFNELFDSQIQRLFNLGCPNRFLDIFEYQKDMVIEEAMKKAGMNGSRIPLFLPVIPSTSSSIDYLMTMVRHRGKRGVATINIDCLEKTIVVPKEPYWIFDVDDGKMIAGKFQSDGREMLEAQGRSPLVMDEIIALCIHTNLLSRQESVLAYGSYIRKGDYEVAEVCLAYGTKTPWLGRAFTASVPLKKGFPSCGSRLSFS